MLATLLGFLTVSVSLFAHHGTAVSYNIHKVLVLKGTVAQICIFQPAFPTVFRRDR